MVFRKETKRNTVNCPQCSGDMVAVDVGPCAACGSRDVEILHFYSGHHTYALYDVEGVEILLCDECFSGLATGVDLASGRTRTRFGGRSRTMRLVRTIPDQELKIRKDKFCPHCDARLEFLEFAAAMDEDDQRRRGN